MKVIRIAVFSCALLASCVSATRVNPIESPERLAPLTVSMLPRGLAFAPADVRLVVKVAPHTANRMLHFSIAGVYYRSSEESLEGDSAPVTRTYWFRGVPPGRYVVSVLLGRNDGTNPVIWSEGLCLKGAGFDEECG